MRLTGVRTLAGGPSVMILRSQGRCKVTEPQVIRQTLPDPDGAGMIPVGGGVAVAVTVEGGGGRFQIRNASFRGDMLSRPEQLCRFQEHLHNVLVTVGLGGLNGIVGKKEDVHSAGPGLGCAGTGSIFRRCL